MADDNAPAAKNKLSPEQFEELSEKLWEDFRSTYYHKGPEFERTARAKTAEAILKLQDYKP